MPSAARASSPRRARRSSRARSSSAAATIDAVGASVAVPSDALVIDGAGLTVYPGLIDLGNTRAADQPAPPAPQNVRTIAELERWKRLQLLKPQARAADAVKVDDAELTKLAAAGITSVLALPAGEVISGQSALVNVAAPPDEPQIGEPRRTAPRADRGEVAGGAARVVSGAPARERERVSRVADGRHRVRAAGVPRRAALRSAAIARPAQADRTTRSSTRCSPRSTARCRSRSRPTRRARFCAR